MSLISQFLRHWNERLERERAAAPVPRGGGQVGQWFVRVQERVLGFLVSRYGEDRAARREDALIGLAPHTLNTALFDVQPVEVRPRSRERIGSIVRTIHQLNVDAWKGRRWRWFL